MEGEGWGHGLLWDAHGKFHTYLLIAHPRLPVRAINERFLPVWVIFRVGLANESHWLQSVLLLTVHYTKHDI